MKYYLAPLEGNTTYTFRTAYHKNFGGMDRYFTPFIAGSNLSSRERNDILPEHNTGMTAIPQILTGRADEFLEMAAHVAEYGYDIINLNLGCPAATVVSRKRGSGFLAYPEELTAFLDEIFTKCPMKISIKTRIGLESPEEWNRLMDIYEQFPLEELIVHPRVRTQGYGGRVHLESMQALYEREPAFPVCYNGDILHLSPDASGYGSLSHVTETLPGADRVMLGRGILRNPAMLTKLPEYRELAAAAAGDGPLPLAFTSDALTAVKAFHSDLLSGYTKIMSGDANTLFKMKDLWTFLSQSFVDSDKYLKKIRKATRLTEYEAAVNCLFRECEYRPD